MSGTKIESSWMVGYSVTLPPLQLSRMTDYSVTLPPLQVSRMTGFAVLFPAPTNRPFIFKASAP